MGQLGIALTLQAEAVTMTARGSLSRLEEGLGQRLAGQLGVSWEGGFWFLILDLTLVTPWRGY